MLHSTIPPPEGRDPREAAQHIRTVAGLPAALGPCGLIACIPARDEEDRIARCLAALDAELAPGDGIVVVANGCADGTILAAMDATAVWGRPFVLLDVDWKPGEGSGPLARRLALDVAHASAPEAILFSTDADTLVQPGLRSAYTETFAAGFDLVCGAIGFLPEEAAQLPAADPQNEAVIAAYREASREIAAILSPDPDNPWPHHGNIGGANFAIRGAAYALAGPLPTPPSGEDRALLRRVEAVAFRVRYSDEPLALTSPRLDGRARGGLSDELRRNREEADPLVDELLEPPDALLRRLGVRAGMAAGGKEQRGGVLADLGLEPGEAERIAGLAPAAGIFEAERLSPILARPRLRLSDLRAHLPALLEMLAAIRRLPPDNPASRAR